MSLPFAVFLVWLVGGISAGFLLLLADWVMEKRAERRRRKPAEDLYRRSYERWGREVVAEAQRITAEAARKGRAA